MTLPPFLLWNPINLIDGEARWLGWEAALLVGACILSKVLGLVLKKFSQKLSLPRFTLFAEAVYTPAITLIWYLVALFSFELVTDDLLSQAHPKTWSTLLNGGIVLSLGWFFLRFKNKLINHSLEESAQTGKLQDANSMLALSKLLTVVIGIIVIVLLNDFTGMSFTTLLAFGGVGGLALAFASQEIVSNFFGGLMIHMTRPFLLGEIVSIPAHSIEGTVEEIGWYQTRIRSTAKSAVYVPNSLFTKALLVNKSRLTHRLLDEVIFVEISPITSVSVLIQDIEAYVSKHPRFDHAEWAGARIKSLRGNVFEIGVSGLTRCPLLQDFYHVRDGVLLHVAEQVLARGGKLTAPPVFFATKD